MPDVSRYDDIIDLPHHVSAIHPPLPMEARAAQFAPFAALVGFGDAITEADRPTEARVELTGEERLRLGEKLSEIARRVEAHPEVTVTCFRQDERKPGGAYVEIAGRVAKLQEEAESVLLEDGTSIPYDDILDIDIKKE